MRIIETPAIWQSIKNQDDQLEFDWLGIDSLGQLAVFSNFNSGFTPACVTNSMILYNELVEFIDKLEKTSPAIGVAMVHANYNDWKEFAKKGLLGYDNENVHATIKPNRYHLLYKPAKPINAKDYSELKKFEPIIPVFKIEFKDYMTFDELKESLKS